MCEFCTGAFDKKCYKINLKKILIQLFEVYCCFKADLTIATAQELQKSKVLVNETTTIIVKFLNYSDRVCSCNHQTALTLQGCLLISILIILYMVLLSKLYLVSLLFWRKLQLCKMRTLHIL